jgi:hypothetical protein
MVIEACNRCSDDFRATHCSSEYPPRGEEHDPLFERQIRQNVRNKSMEPPSFSFEKLQKKQRFLLECSHFWELNCTFAISLQHPCKYSLTIKI